jgi:hypothetical protein
MNESPRAMAESGPGRSQEVAECGQDGDRGPGGGTDAE